MTTAIKIEHLSKKYVIGHQKQERYTALRDELMHKLRGIGQRLRHPLSPNPEEVEVEEFWALKDINLEIKQGDRVGIIGRNGAGKSTLLKILSRITEPTEGRVHINGRVASLLEVGTGFHPELSGRENIFLNGAILGMSRAEIKKKFDEIVDFAGVEKFLDTPVKRYSSGMYVRLAFAVAAHLEPEILIVDEVLAVGDAQFQKKCLGKMEEVGKEGRTVLFVSHNMAAITSLCQRVVLLGSGQKEYDGPVSEGIVQYYSGGLGSPACLNTEQGKKIGDQSAELISASIKNHVGETTAEVDITKPCSISMQYRVLSGEEGSIAVPNFHFYVADGTCAFISVPRHMGAYGAGEYLAICNIPGNFLNEGTYFIGLALTTYTEKGFNVNFFEQNALSFNARDPMTLESGRYGYGGPVPGVVRPALDWQLERIK
ncbi:ABC transporter ATP-binding protein [Candidatus Parcubacteria bacterium]|nr:MAG: ABC transporter ATP-binding protein [Candidatus Parcubacteria bacterium]